jgi:hypothetical protein
MLEIRAQEGWRIPALPLVRRFQLPSSAGER